VLAGTLDLALRVAVLLESLDIPYVLGGSLASSFAGKARATADIDFAVRLREKDIPGLLAALHPDWYVSEEAVRSAVARRASFNIVHHESIEKVDLFVLGDGLLDRRQLEGRRRAVLSESPRREIWIGSPEDQILRKLEWYRAGGGVSDRQWQDVLAIVSVQGDRLDRDDLRAAADDLGLRDLLERAFEQAGSR